MDRLRYVVEMKRCYSCGESLPFDFTDGVKFLGFNGDDWYAVFTACAEREISPSQLVRRLRALEKREQEINRI